jgi:hypothetical protein
LPNIKDPGLISTEHRSLPEIKEQNIMKKTFLIALYSCAMPFFLMGQQYNSEEFTKGYVCAKLEDRFFDTKIELDVNNTNIIIYKWSESNESQIRNYLEESFPNYTVKFNNAYVPTSDFDISETYKSTTSREDEIHVSECEGGFLPELSPFFPTMLAQPHILGYSVGYRSSDKIFRSSLPISIGDQFSIYQFKLHTNGHLYLGIEACVWAIFEAKTKSLSLINADYFIAFPLTYIYRNFSARFRLFHESSHLGDEFLLDHSDIERFNPSMEGLDLSLAYELTDKFVVFGGFTRIIRSDEGFRYKPNTVYYGFNYFLNFAQIETFNVEWIPFIAGYCENQQNNHWDFDTSVAIGYQWDKYYGHKIRIFAVGHEGYSSEGQFAREKSRYLSINLFYGY